MSYSPKVNGRGNTMRNKRNDHTGKRKILQKSFFRFGIIFLALVAAVAWVIKTRYELSLAGVWTDIPEEEWYDEEYTEEKIRRLQAELTVKEEYLEQLMETDFPRFWPGFTRWIGEETNREELRNYLEALWEEYKEVFDVPETGVAAEQVASIEESMLASLADVGRVIPGATDRLEGKKPGRSIVSLGEKGIAFYDLTRPQLKKYIRREIQELHSILAHLAKTRRAGANTFLELENRLSALDSYGTFETRTRADMSSLEGVVDEIRRAYLTVNKVRLLYDIYWDEILLGIPREEIMTRLREFNTLKEETGSPAAVVKIISPAGDELTVFTHFKSTVTIKGPLSALALPEK